MEFAPLAFRSTRVKTTEHVKSALLATRDLRNLDAATLRANPSALPTLRMCTAPPLAVDRLVGLASASKSLIGSMEEGKLAARMNAELLDENLGKVCRVLTKLLDRDIFPWLDAGKDPTDHERDRASTIVADRLCSAVAKDIARSARRAGTYLYLMLYPLNGFAARLRKHPERGTEVHELLGQVTGHELRGEGRVYGGGLNKIEPSELGRVSAASFLERWPELGVRVRRTTTPYLFA